VISSERVTPVPIPNTEVKPLSADDSGFAAKVGHRQDKVSEIFSDFLYVIFYFGSFDVKCFNEYTKGFIFTSSNG